MPEDTITKGEKITPANNDIKVQEVELEPDFLIWPDFKVVENDMLKSINRYKNQLIRNRDTVDTLRDWEDEKITNLAILKFTKLRDKTQRLLENDGNCEKVEKELKTKLMRYENLIRNWEPNRNVELARVLYQKVVSLLEEYSMAYEDLINHRKAQAERKKRMAKLYLDKINCDRDSLLKGLSQKLDTMEWPEESQTSKISAFFDELSTYLSISLGLQFHNPTRLKAFKKFMDKIYDRAETLDHFELDSFNDIYGTMFVVSNSGDEEVDVENCYSIINQVCKWMSYKKADFLVPKFVGSPSLEIYPEYRIYMKDYIQNPKPSGYEAVHCCFAVEIIMPNGQKRTIRFEVQVVTLARKLKANTAEDHKTYKKARRSLNWKIQNIRTDGFMAKKEKNGSLSWVDYDGFLEALPLNSRRDFW